MDMDIKLNNGGDLAKMLEVHRAVKRQVTFISDAKTEALQGVNEKPVLLKELVSVYDTLVQEFCKRQYTRGEALKAATDLLGSPLLSSTLNFGI